MRHLIALLIALTVSFAYADDISVQPGITSFTLTETIDGQTVDRPVIIQAPSEIDSSKHYPIVIALHGHGGQAEGFISRFSQAIETYQFIGVYPQGYNQSWNVGGKSESDANDFTFIDRIVAKIKLTPALKESPLYAMGFSNGALFANELAVEKPYFKGIAAFSSNLLSNEQPTDKTTPVSVLLVRGLQDKIIPNTGGYDDKVDHDFLSTDDTLTDWANSNHCKLGPSYAHTPYGNQRITFSQCDDNTQVIGYLCPECGHGIPDEFEGDQLALIFEFFKGTSAGF